VNKADRDAVAYQLIGRLSSENAELRTEVERLRAALQKAADLPETIATVRYWEGVAKPALVEKKET
jgi:hypothetical protein